MTSHGGAAPTGNGLSEGSGLSMMVNVVVRLAAVAWLTWTAAAAATEVTVPAEPPAIIADHGLAPQDVGYVLFDAETGSILEAWQADHGFIPASVAKVPTTVAALAVLGPDHRFETTVHASGAISDGVLDGDLYLRGGGDPFLSSDDLAGLVRTLRDAGLTRVDGAFYFDETELQPVPQITENQPADAHYNPGVSALSVNFNIIELSWRRDPQGTLNPFAASIGDAINVPVDWVAIGTALPDPDAFVPYLRNEAVAGDGWLLSPALPDEGATRLPLREPGRHTAMVFRWLCAEMGIEVPEPQAGRVAAQARLLAGHRSGRLDFIAERVLRYSNNLSAELIGQATAERLIGAMPDLRQSGRAIEDWLRAQRPNVDWTGFVLDNQSGLSSTSRATPRQLAAILALALELPLGEQGYDALLRPMRWEAAVNEALDPERRPVRLRAKTGTMYYASTLAGFLERPDGRRLGFAVFVNDLDARLSLDATMDLRTSQVPQGARGWLARARRFERALLTDWSAREVGPPQPVFVNTSGESR